MFARIYRPARTAMQSGRGKTRSWILEFEPESPREVEPFMGWTSSRDTLQQVSLTFSTKAEAIAYARAHKIPHRVFEPRDRSAKRKSYSDNFAYNRREPWTH
ncbi:MAG: ETC complex I subunit [Alphaproteobacteria bacterium]|nr:ETC complex I subunit [Alphaproteobacteria bacterium]